MNVVKEALEFAIIAHGDKVRKAEKEKPEIVHLIDVGNILKEYGFDDNVIAAGYLHDVVENIDDITIQDIYREFGEDIGSLVKGATEPDRNLSWEERKLGTINRIKTLDIRHKAVILADKISNTEDLLNLFGRQGKRDFSSFNRGKDKKIWYWSEAYKSLILNEDENHPMFIRLKKNIELLANDEENKININIFGKEIDKDLFLRKLYYKGLENYKLKSIQKDLETYVICLLESPEYSSKKIINNIKNYFEIFDFSISFLNLSWSIQEIEKLSQDQDGTIFRKMIDYRLKKVIASVKSKNDLVLIDSNIRNDLAKLTKVNQRLNIKNLEYLKYYFDVVSQLINSTILLEKNKNDNDISPNYISLENFLMDQDNYFRYNYSLYDDGSILCDKILGKYKEEQLNNIKKLIKR